MRVDSHLAQTVTNVARQTSVVSHISWKHLGNTAVVTVALVTAGINSFLGNDDVEKQPNMETQAVPTMTATSSLEKERVPIELTGTVMATERELVYAKSPGRIQEVFVTDGETVQSGQPILRLENPMLSRQLDDAKRNVAAAKRELERFVLQKDQERAESQITLLQVRNAYQEALRKYDNDGEMYKLGFISRQQLRHSKEGEERARLSFETRVQREATTDKSNELRREEHVTQLHKSEQRLTQILSDLAALEVSSASNGTVDLAASGIPLEIGRQLSAWTVVAHVYQQECLCIQFKLDQVAMNEVTMGQEANVCILGKRFPTRIAGISTFEKSYVAIADLPEDAVFSTLRPGQEIQGILGGL